jgi:hypothetical protein
MERYQMNKQYNHGRYTADTEGEKGRASACGQDDLQQQEGSSLRNLDVQEKPRDRIIRIENGPAKYPLFIVRQASVVEDIFDDIKERYPELASSHLFLRVWNGRYGTSMRKEFVTGIIPYDYEDLYVQVCLAKR